MARSRHGMALVAVLAVMSLLAILAMATLSVTTRLTQGSTLTGRDGRLGAAAAYALTTGLLDWRANASSTLTVGASQRLLVAAPGSEFTTWVTITRLTTELFWVGADAAAVDDAHRRESMVVRLVVPRTDSLPPMIVGGNVILSRWFSVVNDTAPGCAPAAPNLRIEPGASLTSVDGQLPIITIDRNPAVGDSTRLFSIGSISTASLGVTADLVLPDGASAQTPSGIVHAVGDLTLTSGSGAGVLIVDGRLTLAGAITYTGLIVARDGIITTASGSDIKGSIRVGVLGARTTSLILQHPLTFRPSACATQVVLTAAVIPYPVAGRRWAEMY